MPNPVEQAELLKREADRLLARTGIRAILAKHGDVTFTGSYFYDLMTWRDIDICLSVDAEPMPVAAAIATEICRKNDVACIYIRNEHVLKTSGNPKAVFICMEFLSSADVIWKVDVLLGTAGLVAETVAPGKTLVSKLTPRSREAILTIKSELCKSPDYRQAIRSTDIYQAVLEGGVRNRSEWNTWCMKNRRAQAGLKADV